jgi:perosamine synthetase
MTVIPVARPWLGEEEVAAVSEVIRSGWVAQGPRVAEFEGAFATTLDGGHAVAVSSCTTALHLSLVLLGVGPGDEVVVPSMSFIATANVVRYVGATPVFADIDEATLNITATTVRPVLSGATAAVIAVHQAGVPADIDALHSLCDPLGVAVVEDAACAAGSTYRGRPVGAGGLAAFSFHPRKLITTGEGGMLTTSDVELAARARRLREHGMDVSAADRHASRGPVFERYTETGFNFRMTDVQAAMGLVQLGRLPALIERRRRLAARYQGMLASTSGITVVDDPPYGTTNYQSFWIVLSEDFPVSRDDLLSHLADRGISARRGIMAAHLEPAYAGCGPFDLPATERLTNRSLILPLYHDMTEAEQDRVVHAVHGASEWAVSRV